VLHEIQIGDDENMHEFEILGTRSPRASMC